jgi:hypothetical protein
MVWLHKNAFETQDWLINPKILANINENGYTDRILSLQNRQLYTLLNPNKLGMMMDAEVINPKTYTALDMIRDLKLGIFSEANYTRNVDVFRRNLQKSMISRMGMLLNSKDTKNSDISSIIRGELEALNFQLSIAKNRSVNRITKYHYQDCVANIRQILDPK